MAATFPIRLSAGVRRGTWGVAAAVCAAAATLAVLRIAPAVGPESRVSNTVVLTKSPEAVFAYVTTPANWPKWHPSSIAVRGTTDRPLAIGETVIEDFAVAGRRGTAEWVVREREFARRWTIEGSVAGSAGRGRVTYTLEPDVNGTRFERTFSYRFGSLLGELLDRLYVRDRIAAESSEAVTRLQQAIDDLR